MVESCLCWEKPRESQSVYFSEEVAGKGVVVVVVFLLTTMIAVGPGAGFASQVTYLLIHPVTYATYPSLQCWACVKISVHLFDPQFTIHVKWK